jgi:hypothetical protein
MEISGKFHAPAALTLEKNPVTHLLEGCKGSRGRCAGFEVGKISFL